MLAEVALALRALDVHAGGVRRVADVAEHRLDPRGAEDRVVDVVLVRGDQVAVVLVVRLLVRVLHEDELQLGAGDGDVAEVGGALHLLGEDRPRRLYDGLVVGPDQVALHHRGGREVRKDPEGVEVEHELHVAVAAVPRGDRVTLHGVHVDVDTEQVVAALGAVAEHLR